jgi:histidinol-phosphatase (PHP family)
MAESGLYDVVSHFDLPKKRGAKLDHKKQRKMVLPVLDQIRKSGMSIEINTSGLIHEAKEIYPSPEILSWACEREIPIVFGSDAHSPDRVGANFKEAVALAKEVGYTHYNTYSNRVATPVALD